MSRCSPLTFIRIQDALKVLHTPSAQPVPLDSTNEADTAVIQQLKETMGDFFAERLWGDSAWARAVLTGDTSEG